MYQAGRKESAEKSKALCYGSQPVKISHPTPHFAVSASERVPGLGIGLGADNIDAALVSIGNGISKKTRRYRRCRIIFRMIEI